MADDTRFPIVGIGASAGGIPAFEGLFGNLPGDGGLAFVVITHLSPDRQRMLHEVIATDTRMRVIVAKHGMRVETNNIYVMPENAILTIQGGLLQIRGSPISSQGAQADRHILRLLAEDQGEMAVGIVLSGGDGDGTLGVKAIKEAGGLTLAQTANESGPKYPDMPQSAISTGMIDISVPVDEMGPRLVAFARSLDVLEDLTRESGNEEDAALEDARRQICTILRSHTGYDFVGYKTKTFFRRVRRRIQVHQLHSMETYIARPKSDADEVVCLFRDLLINVTNFSRDPDAFELLSQTVLPSLFEGKGAGDAIRVWVPGCATGEEVFSLAILMREYMERHAVNPKVQIFATDIDEPALAVARLARYPENLLQGVSEERRRRFFRLDGSSYVLNPEELCIFSPDILIRDPPFSRMDLVSCRNLLIYFGPEIQRQVIPTFHYSLKPGGYLFLGSSESTGSHGHLFNSIDKKFRIFQTRETPSQMPRLPSLRGHDRSIIFPDGRNSMTRDTAAALKQAAEARILQRYAPAHVIVTAEGDIVHYSPGTGRFLETAPGAPSRQLMTIARPGLRLDVRSTLREATQSRRAVTRDNLSSRVMKINADRVGHGGAAHRMNRTRAAVPCGFCSAGSAPAGHSRPVSRYDREQRGTRSGTSGDEGQAAVEDRGVRNGS